MLYKEKTKNANKKRKRENFGKRRVSFSCPKDHSAKKSEKMTHLTVKNIFPSTYHQGSAQNGTGVI